MANIQIHKILNTYLSKYLGRDGENSEYRIMHPHSNITKDELTKAIRKYYKDQTLDVMTIYNPDTKANQTIDEFITYVNTYGLGAWDTGEGD